MYILCVPRVTCLSKFRPQGKEGSPSIVGANVILEAWFRARLSSFVPSAVVAGTLANLRSEFVFPCSVDRGNSGSGDGSREGSFTKVLPTQTLPPPPTTMSTAPSLSAHPTGYSTPGYPPTTTVSFSHSLPMTTLKPKIPKVNVFSNDGFFLERFNKLNRVRFLIPSP